VPLEWEGTKRFAAVVRLRALHLSLRAPSARVDLSLDKERLLGVPLPEWERGLFSLFHCFTFSQAGTPVPLEQEGQAIKAGTTVPLRRN
jgi:hypothetical protein